MPGVSPEFSEARRSASRARLLIAGGFLILLLLVFDVGSGAAGLSWTQVWSAIFPWQQTGDAAHFIVWELRLPQAFMAILAGAALGLAGAEMQTVLDNPLASPFTLGVSSAAALGAALSLSLGIHKIGRAHV